MARNKPTVTGETMAGNRVTRTQLAGMLGCSVSTIRKYEREFAAWLVTPPGVKGKPQAKVYEGEDVRTLSVIHQLRLADTSFADMKTGQLDEALESGQYEVMPEGAEGTQEGEEPQSSALVPMEKYALAMGKLQALDSELTRVLEERDKAQEELVAAERRAAAASATTDERNRLLERLERMEDKLDSVQEELQSERTKSWWDKLRKR